MKESLQHSSVEEVLQLWNLVERVYAARSFEELSATLPMVAQLTDSPSALLYIDDPRLTASHSFHHGIRFDAGKNIQDTCREEFQRIMTELQKQPITLEPSNAWGKLANSLYPLRTENICIGILGLVLNDGEASKRTEVCQELQRIFSSAVNRLAEQSKTERQLAYLNTYLTVSSMIAQPLGLHELLETILYACLDAASAAEASIMLLDDDKKNLCFYQIEGPSKPVLMGATFPADRGIAGFVLQSQCSEIINDVQNDPRFYGKIDSDSGFVTRNMIAIPLSAGEERIGVLEVLNKADGGDFTEEEHRLLLSIAEEIAFAVRNAKVFEYVVDSYCKQRQGQHSCKGCKRPLGTWTPCVKYREAAVL